MCLIQQPTAESVFPQDNENLVVDYSSDIDDVFGSDVKTDEEY